MKEPPVQSQKHYKLLNKYKPGVFFITLSSAKLGMGRQSPKTALLHQDCFLEKKKMSVNWDQTASRPDFYLPGFVLYSLAVCM